MRLEIQCFRFFPTIRIDSSFILFLRFLIKLSNPWRWILQKNKHRHSKKWIPVKLLISFNFFEIENRRFFILRTDFAVYILYVKWCENADTRVHSSIMKSMTFREKYEFWINICRLWACGRNKDELSVAGVRYRCLETGNDLTLAGFTRSWANAKSKRVSSTPWIS